MKVELLWFDGCPNHEKAEAMVRQVASGLGVTVDIERIEVPDEETGVAYCFPGSPTIRVEGVDVEPGWEPCEDCTPRCRVYATSEGLRGVPEEAWVEQALREAAGLS
jgi:hypothetical protein